MTRFPSIRRNSGGLFSQTDTRELELSVFDKPSPMDEDDCLYQLHDFCHDNHIHVSWDMQFRFACFYDFDYEKTKDSIVKKHRCRYLYLRMEAALVDQFMTQALFPLPGLKTKHTNSEVIYFCPAKYQPSQKGGDLLVDNLCYILNQGCRTERGCRNGMAFLANMHGFSARNIHHGTIVKMVQMLQGDMVPTKIEFVIIVDPPAIFTRAWKAAKKAINGTLFKKVYFIRQERLGEFLMDGYKEFLPDEFSSGWRDVNEIVEDYVDLMRYQDEHNR
ncbi:unnamed protein product [Cylindrotheca closterium]|uniref:CRAL-TRIO domain-containing protein n=1 Tax=Cylindrotheca closterium TaxID=2856 RepID=A0AAD2FQT3_9STRA|nr:unnamed protein product [Cylindrotheca closterium]